MLYKIFTEINMVGRKYAASAHRDQVRAGRREDSEG